MFEDIGFSSRRSLGSGGDERNRKSRYEKEIIVDIDGNGDTDDIREAIKMVGNEGGRIIIKVGTYEINSQINIDKKIKIIGEDGTILSLTTTEGICFDIVSNDVKIENIYFKGNAGYFIRHKNLSPGKENITIRNCTFENTNGGTAWGGIEIKDECKNIRIKENKFINSGISSDAYCEKIFIEKNIFDGGADVESILISQVVGCMINGNIFNVAGEKAIWLSFYFSEGDEGNIIKNNIFEACTTGVYIDSGGYGKGNLISNNKITASASGIYIRMNSDENIISNNWIKANTGIFITGDKNKILGNNLENCTTAYTDNGTNTEFLTGTNTGDQDLTPYWKSDGTSTATGNWDLGGNDLSFTGGDIFTDTYGYFGLGDESNLNWLLGTNDAYLGYSPTGQEFTYLYFGYPGHGSFQNVHTVLRDSGTRMWKVNDDSNDNQIALNLNTDPQYSHFRIDVEGRNVIYATPEYTSIADLQINDAEYLNFGSDADFRFGVDGTESFFLDTKVNNADGMFKVLGDLAVIDNGTLGSDKITNGDFATDASNWTLGTGWSYDTGKIVKVGAGGNTGKAVQTSADMQTPLEVGKIYELSMDVGQTTKTYSNFYVNIAGYTSRVYHDIDTTLKFYFVAKTTDDLEITPNHYNTDFTIDNVTLKEVQAGDFFVGGDIRPMGTYNSSDGTSGATGTIDLTTATSVTVKDGLITGWS